MQFFVFQESANVKIEKLSLNDFFIHSLFFILSWVCISFYVNWTQSSSLFRATKKEELYRTRLAAHGTTKLKLFFLSLFFRVFIWEFYDDSLELILFIFLAFSTLTTRGMSQEFNKILCNNFVYGQFNSSTTRFIVVGWVVDKKNIKSKKKRLFNCVI